ncbi:MAG: DUF2782 domain-containing protein [Burkholderiales bacterium]|nr:DUF2782 domain-containing protein [Burkholderiales bacterium]
MRRFLLLALIAAALSASAQEGRRPQPPGLQPLPQASPPPNNQSDPGLEPEVTIIQRDGAKVEEYRVRGKLFAMKVTPAVGPAYYLVDERGDGQFIRRDNLDTGLRVPRWLILTF